MRKKAAIVAARPPSARARLLRAAVGIVAFAVGGCADDLVSNDPAADAMSARPLGVVAPSAASPSSPSTISNESESMTMRRIRITIGDQQLTATLDDNATANAIFDQLPFTLPMLDRYDRELVHRFDDPLPANEATTSGYEVGDIAYWTPRHSFVIFYAQNGEVIPNLQPVGHIHSGIETITGPGDTDVTFDVIGE